MPELPDRPNIDQLRRQARELLRAAAGGEPSALARIRAFSDRVSLSAAPLAVAREYGFASWPALHAEVDRRLAGLPSGEGGARPGEVSWSFGGASPIEIAAGTLIRVRIKELQFERKLRLVYRKQANLSHAALAFLKVVEAYAAAHGAPYSFTPERTG